MEMSNVIFGFNGNEVSISMAEQKAKELFHDITEVTILDNEDEHGEDDYSGIRQRVKHPTIEQLIEFFKRNINNEVGSELIKDSFYHNYRGKWTKILVSIHNKIQDALKMVEISENGKYEKIRYGKYVRYIFVRNKMETVTLDNYGIY